jgi:hypothetical protein
VPTPNRGVRVDLDDWARALTALRHLTSPRRVVITLKPGMSRTDAVNEFIAHVARLQEDPQ